MHPVVNIALRAARDAASAIAHTSDRLDRVKVVESNDGHVITNVDQDAERTILYHLQKAYPEHSFNSRISGYMEGTDEENVWLIDPLVGNRNFMHGFGHFCVSIALRTANKINHAVVVNPLLNEEYTASRGAGAQLSTRRIRASRKAALEKGFVFLDADYRQSAEEEENGKSGKDEDRLLQLQRKLALQQCAVRLTGCPALDMVYVAAGKAEAGWSRETSPWAIGAAQLILQEAGGMISGVDGNPDFFDSREIVFGNPKCFKQMLQLCR